MAIGESYSAIIVQLSTESAEEPGLLTALHQVGDCFLIGRTLAEHAARISPLKGVEVHVGDQGDQRLLLRRADIVMWHHEPPCA